MCSVHPCRWERNHQIISKLCLYKLGCVTKDKYSHESHNSEILSNLGIRKYFHVEILPELRAEECLGKGEESLRERIPSKA